MKLYAVKYASGNVSSLIVRSVEDFQDSEGMRKRRAEREGEEYRPSTLHEIFINPEPVEIKS